MLFNFLAVADGDFDDLPGIGAVTRAPSAAPPCAAPADAFRGRGESERPRGAVEVHVEAVARILNPAAQGCPIELRLHHVAVPARLQFATILAVEMPALRARGVGHDIEIVLSRAQPQRDARFPRCATARARPQVAPRRREAPLHAAARCVRTGRRRRRRSRKLVVVLPARNSSSRAIQSSNGRFVRTPSMVQSTKRTFEARNRRGAVAAEDDDLGEHRIVVVAHHAACGDSGVDAHARALRRRPVRDRARSRAASSLAGSSA